ncbi:MAG: hypothetical protein PHG66_03065 [Candidatus Colwellbacteria bacterium]|nr:hypothetical protein [Candidatus Colwellbacteria bacterium]
MQFTGLEIMVAGTCPLNCSYCYIPKTPGMDRIHRDVLVSLEDESVFKRAFNLAGGGIENIGFWGTEPAIVMDVLTDKIPTMKRIFPLLRHISFSTSGIAADPIIPFVKAASRSGINVNIQVSLDGPDFISDVNRFSGAADIVPNNVKKIVSALKDIQAKLVINWKPTLTLQNMKEMDDSKIREYFDFFKRVNTEIISANKNPNIRIAEHSAAPTPMLPGKYTALDGVAFAEFIRRVHATGNRTAHTIKMIDFFRRTAEFKNDKKRMMCGAGNSFMAVGGRGFICHRSFFFDDDDYVDAAIAGTDEWLVAKLNRKTVEMLRKWYMPDPDDKGDIERYLHVMEGFHRFNKLAVSNIEAATLELAMVGQVDREFLDDPVYLRLFALFMSTASNCPFENILNTSSANVMPFSMIRFHGNGAFREVIKTIR